MYLEGKGTEGGWWDEGGEGRLGSAIFRIESWKDEGVISMGGKICEAD